MVTFTLPAELRGLFFSPHAKTAYDLFFKASSQALSQHLAKSKNLQAATSWFTGILHTWNQRLHYHPHIHYIVPGSGLNADGAYVRVKNENFLLRIEPLKRAFRWHMRRALKAHGYRDHRIIHHKLFHCLQWINLADRRQATSPIQECQSNAHCP